VACVNAQSSAYTDDRSNITYQQFTSADTGYSFGYAFPVKSNDTMMGLITAPIKAGWVGLSFGGGMRNALLLVAWNNNGNMTGDLRYTQSYSMPKAYDGKTNPVLIPLGCSSGFNDTHWFLAFACQSCNAWTNSAGSVKGGFDIMAKTTKFGWAYSDTPPVNPADPRSGLQKHSDAGRFTVNIDQSRSSKFEQWVNDCAGPDDDDEAMDMKMPAPAAAAPAAPPARHFAV
jgi:hypothetical protein